MTDHAAVAVSTLVLKHLRLDEYSHDLLVSHLLERAPHGVAQLITQHPSYYLVARKTLGQLAVTVPR